MIWLIVVLAIVSPLAVIAVYVEDWSRDLTTNTAASDESADDSRLWPLLVRGDRPALDEALKAFRDENDAWIAGDRRPLPEDSPLLEAAKEHAAVHLVRTTGLMKYRDDVWIAAEDAGEGRLRIHAESRSRIGLGDLGQNPRNLRELMGFLRERLGESD